MNRNSTSRHQLCDRRGSAAGSSTRHGVAMIWFLAMLPLSIACLQFVLEIGWMNLARSELQIAVEGAALAGARLWGPNSDDATTRTMAKSAAHDVLAAHTVSGDSAVLAAVSTNDSMAATNNNLSCPGTILLGALSGGTFSAGTSPASPDERACRVEITISVASPFGLGTRSLSGNATAVWNSSSERAQLRGVTTLTCL